MIAFFDRHGRATAYCEDGKSLYFWDGKPAAYIDGDAVFAYPGHHVGWCQDGWIVDAEGGSLLFESDAIRGPAKPERASKSVPGPRQARPVKGAQSPLAARPVQGTTWSNRTFADLT